MRLLFFSALFLSNMGAALPLFSQDTFSVVAADSTTRFVGSAGASCVDLNLFPGFPIDFLGDLLPNKGAINTQASYVQGNQTNARTRMNSGSSPQEIIDWLKQNDVQGNAGIRQYGIVGFQGSGVSAAAHTGINCINYKNHITGSIHGIHYSIQGNILSGQAILDSMERRFRAAGGDLACRLMAAMQGANVVGADTRCAPNGTSSLFAFLKVSGPNDPYNSPSFLLAVKTAANAGVEPIDSLQALFDAARACGSSAVLGLEDSERVRVFPNPAGADVSLLVEAGLGRSACRVFDVSGRQVFGGLVDAGPLEISTLGWAAGLYLFRVETGAGVYFRRVVIGR
jgi:uncharacterized Ntn-hydrolase superfamily protein